MTDQDARIYLDLYDIARRNMRQNGLVMRFGRDLVPFLVPSEEERFDLDEMEDLSCHDFIFACYMRLLGRLPEMRITHYPGEDDPVPPGCDPMYAERVLPTFLNSQEFREYHAPTSATTSATTVICERAPVVWPSRPPQAVLPVLPAQSLQRHGQAPPCLRFI